jgi:hypothetical protein
VAREIQVRSSLQINNGNTNYLSQPVSFLANQETAGGPTPGMVAIAGTGAGTSITLSALARPGLCRIQNLDATNFVQVGVWDGTNFFPMIELLPGESYVVRLARDLNEEYGTGTGTTSGVVNALRAKASGVGPGASINLLVEAFET